tara:strand:- start:11 stop:325 length:315 start_codon:yes stop_codon:yes gene_type:complete
VSAKILVGFGEIEIAVRFTISFTMRNAKCDEEALDDEARFIWAKGRFIMPRFDGNLIEGRPDVDFQACCHEPKSLGAREAVGLKGGIVGEAELNSGQSVGDGAS